MSKKERKLPTVMEEIVRRRKIFEKSEEFKRRIEAIKIPEVRRAS